MWKQLDGILTSFSAYFEKRIWLLQIFLSVLLVFAFWLSRFYLIRKIQKIRISDHVLAGHHVMARNILAMLFVIGMLIIWSQQLQSIALTIAALSVALSIGFKEYLMCAMAALYRAVTRCFRIGDRIEIGGFRGDVIDHSLLFTTLLEVGPGHESERRTGRVVQVFNSLFVVHPFVNESFGSAYTLHTFIYPIRIDENWKLARELLLQSANKICFKYIPKAQHFLEKLAADQGVKVPDAHPSLVMQIHAADRIDLLLRVPVPVDQKAQVEDAILVDFLSAFSRNAPSPITRPLEQ